MAPRVLIVGAGMSGLTAAGLLAAAGLAVTVLDKGRAVGGRMATRTVEGARFDHGAQHFSARSTEMATAVAAWKRAGVAAEWYHSASSTEPDRGIEPRYVGVGGMRRIPEHLAAGHDVRTGIAIDRLDVAAEVTAWSAGAKVAKADALLLTPPLPQVLALCDASAVAVPDPLRRRLEAVEYEACLAVMAHLEGPGGLPDGHLALDGSPIAWMADNRHKGASPVDAVTIHSGPEFAAARLEDDPERWTAELAAAARPHLGAAIVAATGHRWRHARPTTTLDTGSARLPGAVPVVIAGEVFAGARVEGAYLSGRAAAAALLEKL